jgi:hypothetical protein
MVDRRGAGGLRECLLELVDSRRQREPEEQHERAEDEHEEGEGDEPLRHLLVFEPLDARPHRGGEREREE